MSKHSVRLAREREFARSIVGASLPVTGVFRYVQFALIPDYLADGWKIASLLSPPHDHWSVLMRAPLA